MKAYEVSYNYGANVVDQRKVDDIAEAISISVDGCDKISCTGCFLDEDYECETHGATAEAKKWLSANSDNPDHKLPAMYECPYDCTEECSHDAPCSGCETFRCYQEEN